MVWQHGILPRHAPRRVGASRQHHVRQRAARMDSTRRRLSSLASRQVRARRDGDPLDGEAGHTARDQRVTYFCRPRAAGAVLVDDDFRRRRTCREEAASPAREPVSAAEDRPRVRRETHGGGARGTRARHLPRLRTNSLRGRQPAVKNRSGPEFDAFVRKTGRGLDRLKAVRATVARTRRSQQIRLSFAVGAGRDSKNRAADDSSRRIADRRLFAR